MNSTVHSIEIVCVAESSASHSIPHGDASILVSAIKSIKTIVGQNPSSHEKVIIF